MANLGLLGAAVVAPNRLVDLAIGILFPLHCHLGFSAIITDYLPKRKFPTVYPITMLLLYAGTAATIYGLFQYNTKEVGICEGMARLWRPTAKKSEELD